MSKKETVHSNSPIIDANGRTLTRKFLGKIDNFTNVFDKLLEKAHLKAYLAGKSFFSYGFSLDKLSIKHKAWHQVKQSYSYI